MAILIGSLLGTSPLTVVAESSVAIKEGGRTGVQDPQVVHACYSADAVLKGLPPQHLLRLLVGLPGRKI